MTAETETEAINEFKEMPESCWALANDFPKDSSIVLIFLSVPAL